MNRRTIAAILAILLGLLLGPCVFAPNPVEPAAEPEGHDESGGP